MPARERHAAGPGALLLNWLDLDPGVEDDFDLWHNREHAHERVGLPGFRRCRRYVSVETPPEPGFGLLSSMTASIRTPSPARPTRTG